MARNYRSEYDRYQGKPEQIKKRTARNAARAKLAKAGMVCASKAGRPTARSSGTARATS